MEFRKCKRLQRSYSINDVYCLVCCMQEEISAYVSEADSFVKAAGKATAIYDSDISLPQVPITSCFSKPLTLLAACLMSKDPNERLEPREVGT